MTRLPYVAKQDLPPPYCDLPLNASHITMSLSNSPGAVLVSGNVAKHLKNSPLDPRLRELAILQASYSAGSDYAWSHHIEVGFDCGVTEDDLRAIADESAGRQSKLDPLSRAVLSAARELTLKIELSDATFAVLRQSLDNEQMVDLFYAISNYNSVARMIAGFKLAVEPAYLDYLKRFPIKRA